MSNAINVVQHNLSAMFSDRQLGITTNTKAKSSEKLSSGYRINRAADDAAGLSISEKMRRQIRGLTQASKNLQDGVSLAQTADGYLHEVHDMLQRINELAVKGATATLQDVDRQYIDDEVQSLKGEMQRIFNYANFNEIPLFHVPYTPDISGFPNDILTFRSDNGDIGGLEFNNVRYNITELQAKGLQIDNNGVATKDFEVEFSLWDEERVKLSMKEGQTLENVSRNYNWTADETGISINNKLAVKWSEIKHDGVTGVSDTSLFPAGNYSFTYHGMDISFVIENPSELSEVLEGVNGGAATKAATWDARVGGSASSEVASINNSGAFQTFRINETNKDIIDHKFYLSANETGVAVYDQTADSYSERVKWEDFFDATKVSITDEYGRTIETNGGYKIVDWGLDVDGNSRTDITFDGTATYHYANTDGRLPISFDFQLAETASRKDVINALDGIYFGGFGISSKMKAPDVTGSDGSTLTTANTSYGSNSILTSFDQQRDFGRLFSDSLADDKITGTLTWTRAEVTSAADATHTTVKDDATEARTLNASASTSSSETLYYQDGDKYYAVTKTEHADVYDVTWQASESWEQKAEYQYSGTLGSKTLHGHSGVPGLSDVYETYTRTVNQARQDTETYTTYTVSDSPLTTLPDGATVSGSFADVPADSDKTVTEGTIGTVSSGSASITGLRRWNDPNYTPAASIDTFTRFFIYDGNRASTPLSYTHTLTLDSANALLQSGSASAAISLEADGYATRRFQVAEKGTRIDENEFSNVKLNIPKKHIEIQSGSEYNHQIPMEWSPLNLTIVGLSGANTRTQPSSLSAIGMVKNAMRVINEVRSDFGAYQNRFEHAIRLTDNVVENTQRAESLIRDTDMSEEMVRYSNTSILQQAGQAMLAQANQSNQGILTMLS